ncbi:hypothetical protein P9265_14835 [Schinkia azotoformans]|nr:hypothetical protein [Schinkia azotoformans]
MSADMFSKKEMNNMKNINRKDLIRSIAKKVSDRNDEALRRLSKN